ncbi:MAG: AAA domain-containing protein [Hyphomicrobiaceae bacterium]
MPFTLAITDFSTASIADFEVEAGQSRTQNRYMAPEAIASASTVASDWWSLGIILLELLTRGDCFKNVSQQAFVLHVVARGVAIPERLSPRWRNLLEGLLTQDHAKRWKSEQALRWIAGEEEIPTEPRPGKSEGQGAQYQFAGRTFTSPAELALLAAQEAHWDEALAELDHGRFATWVGSFDAKQKKGQSYDLVSRIGSDSRIGAEQRLALALAAMNRDLPLCVRGNILKPADLLSADHWLSPPVLSILRRLKRDRDRWLLQIAERAERVRARAKDAKLELNEEQFAVLRLATSVTRLEAQWARLRTVFPDSPNATVSSLIERRSPSDEDLILLLSLRHEHFKPAEAVLREAEALASGKAGEPAPVPEFDRSAAQDWLARPRRDLNDELNQRIPGFQRCEREKVDDWVDSYRSANRRMPLARLLATLAVPAEEWNEPPEQDYVRAVLGHMHRRVLANIQKGALVQMRPGTSNLDLFVLGASQLAELLDGIVTRSDQEKRLASRANAAVTLFNNVRALNTKAATFTRDTGMAALHVGFPFLTVLDRTEDGDRTRIAPLLLWPVKLNVASGATGSISIASDQTREVTVNPALETILGPVAYEEWSEVLRTAIGDGFDSWSSVLRALGDVIDSEIPDALGPIPKASTVNRPNVPGIRPAAALFLAEFPSQAIASDLSKLQQRPLAGTALQCLLRLGEPSLISAERRLSQIDRFETLEADPSQLEAVARSRREPGLVVQGPPGTGKSQTIVNIITDCLGRGESVLVVCEKKAALDVVQKRLAAERLGDRAVRVENTTNDRLSLINSLKTQVHAVRNDLVNHVQPARQNRLPIAAQIDALEANLDEFHEAAHAVDPRLGLSHRQVLSLIAAQNLPARGLSAPALRQVLGPLTVTELETAIGACTGLVDTWLSGGVPGRPLSILKPFAVDEAQADGLASLLRDFLAADAGRIKCLSEAAVLPVNYRGLACSDHEALRTWLERHGKELASSPASLLQRCAAWRPYFSRNDALAVDGERTKQILADLVRNVDAMAMTGPAQVAHGTVAHWPAGDIATLAAALAALRKPPSLFGFLDLAATFRRRAANRLLNSHNAASERGSMLAHAEAAAFEIALQAHAKEFDEVAAHLSAPRLQAPTHRGLLASARQLALEVGAFERLALIVDECPVPDFWLYVAAAADAEAKSLHPLIKALSMLQTVADARASTSDRLQRMEPFLEPSHFQRFADAIARDAPLGLDRAALLAALPAMVPYQTFRLRYAELPIPARATFDLLAASPAGLSADNELSSNAKIEALMRREAACAWKEMIETQRPLLQRLQSEIASSIEELEALDGKIRLANRRLLASVDRERIRDPAEWSTIWAGGSASKRLRQVFAIGSRLGLLHLKPVWLVNPDVASRMLPLDAGLFDVAIFDEASQMRVVNAMPALFRAKRCVVSGDEKQLPPTSFFGNRADAAADDDFDAADARSFDDASEDGLADADDDAEVAPRIDPRVLQLAERHIRDCEDLLALSRGHLPETSLDIHYRSEFRELIAFSNAAFYGGRLNIPISKSPTEVHRERPLQIKRVDGEYKSQTNPAEADAVVSLLADLWAREASPPTVGVVTFNMKQAELITRRLDQKADEDRAFGKAYLRERTRKAQGEDVGFFVKNLENVQGDERDWIVFSTTFGRDSNGVFRRNFGALSQQGGERRLNVAVTRAKRRNLIVTSMPTDEISDVLGSGRPPTRSRDYLQIYLKYAELINDGHLEDATKLLEVFGPPDSQGPVPPPDEPDELIQQALTILEDEGFDARLMPREDAFSVDIAVSEPAGSRYVLGIVFDGPRQALLRQARARELWRPKLLERSGLRLHRISSSEWVRSPDRERARLIAAARDAIARVERQMEEARS